MTKILVILAHPDIDSSRINKAMVDSVTNEAEIRVHDIYSHYPDGKINVENEQQLIEIHDKIVFQFPLYWYSCPPLLSEWLCQVWQRGWAYGPGGRALSLKTFGVAVSTGSNERDYQQEGRYGRSIREILIPFEMLAKHTSMHYLPPFAIHGAREVPPAQLHDYCEAYKAHLIKRDPIVFATGKDDDRAKTVYEVKYS